MRIKSLSLRNFKAIGSNEQRIEFRPITLLYGPNSAGKSTIVQALHYLSEILSRNNCDPGTTQMGGKLNLGGFRNLVHLHDPDAIIELAIGISLENSLLPSYGDSIDDEAMILGDIWATDKIFDPNDIEAAEVRLGIRWSQQLRKAYVSTYTIAVDGEDFATIVTTSDLKRTELSLFNCMHPMFDVVVSDDEDANTVGFLLQQMLEDFTTIPATATTPSAVAPLQLSFSQGAMPNFGYFMNLGPSLYRLQGDNSVELKDQDDSREIESAQDAHNFNCFNRYISRIIVGCGELARDYLQQFLYLGPLREIPTRHYSPELSPGLARWASGLGAWDQLYNEGERLTKKVNAWLADDQRLDSGYEVHYSEYKPLPIDSALMVALQSGSELIESSDFVLQKLAAIPTRKQVTLRDQRTNIELYPEDLGTGISQVLPVLVAVLGHNKSIVAIEQPELHVHPKFQVELGELFIDAIRDRDTVFILETHSEYMMLRFLRRLYDTANDELEPGANKLVPDDMGVYYVNPIGDSTEITHLRLTEEGEFLDRWPNGFFPERKKELF